MINYLSIDLESWASPNLPEFINLKSREKKKLDNGHIKKSALEILRILKKHNTKLTFFVVGQMYEWYPDVVDKIAQEGHEIGYHTHDHEVLTNTSILTKSIKKSKKFLQRYNPIGFRAPRTVLKPNHLKILKDHGFRYDSSIYSDEHEKKKINGILEIPITSFAKVPVGSGYFIGFLGKHVKLLYKAVNKTGSPVVSYIHNWQVLRPKGYTFPTKKYLLMNPHYWPYMVDCQGAFEYLVENFRFKPIKNLLQ